MGYRVDFDARRCGGAGECVAVCKNGVWTWKEMEFKLFGLRVKRKVPYPEYQDRCTGCKKCEKICPTKCVRIVEA